MNMSFLDMLEMQCRQRDRKLQTVLATTAALTDWIKVEMELDAFSGATKTRLATAMARVDDR